MTYITVDVDLEQLIHDEDEAYVLIKRLDEHFASWGLTEKLYEYFAKLHEEYLAEEKEHEPKFIIPPRP